MYITLAGLGATACCTPSQMADPGLMVDASGDVAYLGDPMSPTVCNPNCVGPPSDIPPGTITGGTGTSGALSCCAGTQLGPLYANLASGDIRYRISDGKDLCDPNCLAVPPGGFTTPPAPKPASMNPTLLIAGVFGVVLLVVASK